MTCSPADLNVRVRKPTQPMRNTKPQVQYCITAIVRGLVDLSNGSGGFSVKVVAANLRLNQSRMTQEFKSRYGMAILDYWSVVRLTEPSTARLAGCRDTNGSRLVHLKPRLAGGEAMRTFQEVELV